MKDNEGEGKETGGRRLRKREEGRRTFSASLASAAAAAFLASSASAFAASIAPRSALT
jgi:hypothetical protein